MWYTRMVLSFNESALWVLLCINYVGDNMFDRLEKMIGKEKINY